MRANESYDIEAGRLNPVIKSNELIQKSRYQLSLQEQKVLLYLISKIRPEDEDFAAYEFQMRDLCKLMGISCNPKNYKNFRDTIQALADKSFWIERDGKDVLCRWLTEIEIEPGTSIVGIQLDAKLKPYLLQLQKQFTMFSLEYILLMRNKYSIRIYELLKSYEYQRFYTVNVEEFKHRIQVNGYSNYTDFRVKVLDIAISEINRYTDIDVDVVPIREGRSICYLEFEIMQKDLRAMEYSTIQRRNGFARLEQKRLPRSKD